MKTSMWAGLAVSLLAGVAQAQQPPHLDLVLTPHATQGADSYLGVVMTLEKPSLAAGAGLTHLPLTLVGIPSARYDGDALTARDAAGPLPLVQSEEPPTPQGTYRRWSVTRATVGDVTVSYHAPPRRVTAATNNGPLFDLRQEAGGFVGAGVGFIATPVASGPYRVRLHWDLSAAPAGSMGVWSLGEGDVEAVVPAEVLSFSYYEAGPLKAYPTTGRDKFGLYWLGEPPFDAAVLGDRVQKLYGVMADFFAEHDATYRVFMRQNPYRGTGGSGLARSFMFGYEPAAKPTVDSLQGLLSHEIAHNWPSLEGEHGDTAWYTEGTAEYYSLFLAYRGGLLTTDQFLTTLNERAAAYYSNPYRGLSNPAAAKIFWSDAIAQTVPYGRGFFYLQATDAAIRAKTGGRRSLDDVVKTLRVRQVKGEAYGIPEWLALVGAEIGPEAARKDYEAMASGALMTPTAGQFAPCFAAVATTVKPFQLGFARASLNDDRVVRGLEAGSAAAQAGVRGGDVIVTSGDLNKVRADETLPLALTLRRDGAEIAVSYLPRGAPVSAWRWTRDPKTPDTACRF